MMQTKPQQQTSYSEEELNKAFDKSEDQLLIDALKRTPEERFLFALDLYKMQKMLERGKITHYKDNSEKK